jgi:hypothetical protein
MISANCDILELIPKLENKNFFEMIDLLNREATEAERQLYNPNISGSKEQICGSGYVSDLKNIIFYLRYGARPKGLRKEHTFMIDSICEKYDHFMEF